MASPLQKIFDLFSRRASAGSSGMKATSFEAAKQSKARSNIYSKSPTDFRQELDASTRREIVRKSRYLEKNSGLLREYIQSMAIYSVGSTGIQPQARTKDRRVNAMLEANYALFAQNPEISGRFSDWEIQNLLSRSLDRDGEMFIIKTKDASGPKIQIVEAHRVGNGSSIEQNMVDGIRYGRYGEVISYRIIQDDGSTQDLPANSVIHVYDKQQASGGRGYPTLQHSICHLIDQMEMLSNEKRATLDQSKISIHLEKASGEIDDEDEKVFGSGSANSKPENAGYTYVTEPGEKINLLESKRPNSNFMPWMDFVARDAVMGGLPWEFIADSSKVGAAGVKLSLAKASRLFKHRQAIICRALREIWFYVNGFAIDSGSIPAVDGWWDPQFMLPKQISLDVNREAYQNRLDIEFGLKSRTEDFAERQQDFEEQMQLRADEAETIMRISKERNLPIEWFYKPSFNWLQPGLGGKPGAENPALMPEEPSE